jgi:hypothetical protein
VFKLFLIAHRQPGYFSVSHQLTTSNRQKEKGSVQHTTQPISTSTSHMTEAKKDMKGDSKAKDGEAMARPATNVAKAIYQCTGMLLTQ